MKKLIAFLLGTKHITTAPASALLDGLNRQREYISGLIDNATHNADPIALLDACEQLTEVQKAIANAHRAHGKFSNLY